MHDREREVWGPQYKTILSLLVIWVLSASTAQAACFCTCLHGNTQPVCDHLSEKEPLCPAQMCLPARPHPAPYLNHRHKSVDIQPNSQDYIRPRNHDTLANPTVQESSHF